MSEQQKWRKLPDRSGGEIWIRTGHGIITTAHEDLADLIIADHDATARLAASEEARQQAEAERDIAEELKTEYMQGRLAAEAERDHWKTIAGSGHEALAALSKLRENRKRIVSLEQENAVMRIALDAHVDVEESLTLQLEIATEDAARQADILDFLRPIIFELNQKPGGVQGPLGAIVLDQIDRALELHQQGKVDGLMNDTERLDWLEKVTSEGACPGLINDDNGHWTVAFDGIQTVPSGDGPEDVQTSFFIEAANWHDSVREAIDAAYAESLLVSRG